MKAKILLVLPLLIPMVANADIAYRVQHTGPMNAPQADGHDSAAFARMRRFYIGGAYNFAMWSDYTDDAGRFAAGENNSSFDVVAGLRLYDVFRIEANYINTRARWNAFALHSDTVMLNAIFDARIDNLYRLFYNQRIVPYVGVGAGASFNRARHAEIENKVTPTIAALAGVAFELGDRFTLDFGYRYMYMFTPQFDVVNDLAPQSHQFRAGARINF